LRVLAIVHQADAGPGVFTAAIRGGGHQLDQWLLPENAEPPADPHGYDAVLTLGGAMNADQGDRHPWLGEEDRLLGALIQAGTPVLGLCLGSQLVAAAAGGAVRRAARPEIGWHRVELTAEGRRDPLLGPLAPSFEALQWHSYEFAPPAGGVALASSEVCLQAARVGERAWAIQFHPEVSPADAASWIVGYRSDEDAVRIGIDPAALGAETKVKIGAFNQLGRELCRRWLAQAG
jgi:GMP synthase-like glutamine amidotransferase